MTNNFHFEPSQRELIRDIAKHLRNIGYIWALISLLSIVFDFLDFLIYLSKVQPINVLKIFRNPMEDRQFFDLIKPLLKDPLYIIVGLFAVRASSFLWRIADHKGEDIENLFLGLGQLRNALFTLYLFIVIFVVVLWIRIIFFATPSTSY